MKPRILMLFVLGVAAVACGLPRWNVVRGSGNVVERTFEVSGFDQVELATVGTLYIEQGETESLSIETDDNILDLLIVSDNGGRLLLGDSGGGDLRPTDGITFRLTVRDLRTLTANSSGRIVVGPLQAEDLQVEVGASGDVSIESLDADSFSIVSRGSGGFTSNAVSVDSVEARVFSSGSVELAGETDSLTAELGSSGGLRAGDLAADDVVVVVSSSGGATVHARDSLDVTISSSGSVEYYGSPTLTQSLTGSGRITALGAR